MSANARKRRQQRRAHAQAANTKERTPGQRRARTELLDLVERPGPLLSVADLHAGKGKYHARVRIATDNIPRVASGLPIADSHEDIEVWFGDGYPNHPPTVLVADDRFVGFPHVLIGRILCIYLDTDREWHPALGAQGVITRLIDWLADAAADRFDERSALYHPIGGLPPSPRAPGTLVVRHSDPAARRSELGLATLRLRGAHRADLLSWTRQRNHDAPDRIEALVLRTAKPMPHGLVQTNTLGDLLARVQDAEGPDTSAVLAAAQRLVGRIGDQPLRIVVDIAHPTHVQLSYLATAVASVAVPSSLAHQPELIDHLPELPIGWPTVSDERTEVATRRDSQRPASAFYGKTVELWGCGGLGSWIAEFIARAGARRLILRDSGATGSGLLVRQNYTEDDVGLAKATQLAHRLQAISDNLEVEPKVGSVLDALAESFAPDADLLIDATINVTVAARLDEWRRSVTVSPLIAQVATDPRTATLGLLVVASPSSAVGPATIDDATWSSIQQNAGMERFHGFWTPTTKADQVVPALGCSTPTFHGSAADLASLAGSLVSLVAAHLGNDASGTHLIEASHARGAVGGGHLFVPYP